MYFMSIAFFGCAILLLLILNGFFVMSEYALLRVRRGRLEELQEEGNPRAGKVLRILDMADSYLSTIQIGITVSSISMGVLGMMLGVMVLSPLLPGGMGTPVLKAAISLVVIVFLHVIFGELVPRAAAVSNVERTALAVAYPLVFFHYMLYPLVGIASNASRTVQRLLGISKPAENIARSENELRRIVIASEKEGELDHMESRMIDNVFEFSDLVAREVMVPRQDMDCLFTDDPLAENMETVRSSRHTRYPLCYKDKDQVLGTVHVRDLLDIRRESAAFDLRKIMRPISVVPEAMPVSRVLQMMQKQHVQMVLVADEYGGTAGLITMEDLVEEIVGEIQDEHEADEPDPIVKLPDGSCEFDGMVLLNNVSEVLHIAFDDPEEDTIGGYVFGLLGRRPEEGDSVIIGDYCFKVLVAEGFRVMRVQARKIAEPRKEQQNPAAENKDR